MYWFDVCAEADHGVGKQPSHPVVGVIVRGLVLVFHGGHLALAVKGILYPVVAACRVRVDHGRQHVVAVNVGSWGGGRRAVDVLRGLAEIIGHETGRAGLDHVVQVSVEVVQGVGDVEARCRLVSALQAVHNAGRETAGRDSGVRPALCTLWSWGRRALSTFVWFSVIAGGASRRRETPRAVTPTAHDSLRPRWRRSRNARR